MWRQVVAQSPGENAPEAEVVRYDVGWKALNTMLKSGRSLSGHERNCCFLNTRGGRFANVSAASSLDFDDDGRILATADWDNDGDLDFWIANRTGPQVRFMRNDAANEHNFVRFKLEGVNCNRDAIGARVELQLAGTDHPKRIRTLRAGEGYLGQSSKWLHFGLGDLDSIESVTVKWPDGTVDSLAGVEVNKRYRIRQGDSQATLASDPKRNVQLTPSKVKVPEATDKSRIVLISPIPLPNILYESYDSKPISVGKPGRAKLVNLWATWCQPCVKELAEWNSHADQLKAAGLDVVTINVDEPKKDRDEQKKQISEMIESLGLPFAGGYGTADMVNQFDVLQRSILRRQQSLPVPSSFMIDARGNLRVIYKGPVDTAQLLADAKLLDAPAEAIVAASTPYAGKWLGQPGGTSPNQLAVRFVEGGYLKEAEDYIRQLASMKVDNPMYKPADAMVLLGAICSDAKRYEEAADAFKLALQANPHHRQSHIELASVLVKMDKHLEAVPHYEAALERRPNDPELRLKLALALVNSGKHADAERELRRANELRPSAVAHHHLGNTLIALGRIEEAVENYEESLQYEPDFAPPANNLAWLLATNSKVVNGERAVEIAEQLVARATRKDSGEFDTLAAAHAANGSFDKAMQFAEQAVELAKKEGDEAKAGRIQNRLELYRQQKPYKE